MVEVLVASTIGLITLGIVTSVFVASLRSAEQRGKRLLLVQSLSSVMQQIKRDVQRAGFNRNHGHSVKLTDSHVTLYVDAAEQQLGYVYRLDSARQSLFRNVVYKYQPSSSKALGGQLKVCEKHSAVPLSFSLAALSGWQGNCYNMFNPKQISIVQFEITTEKISGSAADNQLLSVRLVGQLQQDPNVSYQTSIQIVGRNWQ